MIRVPGYLFASRNRRSEWSRNRRSEEENPLGARRAARGDGDPVFCRQKADVTRPWSALGLGRHGACLTGTLIDTHACQAD